MTHVAATSVDADQFNAVVFDPDTDHCLARAREHVTEDHVDLRVGTQTITIADDEVAGAITVLGWYAQHRQRRLDEQADQIFRQALDVVGERR